MSESRHILSAFDKDLDQVHTLTLTMGGLVETAIAEATKALEQRDEERAQRVIEGDKRIDALEDQINAAVIGVLARHSPTATDLRAMFSVIKVVASLERVGDYAKNMAKRTTVLAHMNVDGTVGSIKRLSKSVRMMLKDSLDSYARRDPQMAEDVRLRDGEVDQMHSAIFRELLTHMLEDPRNITPCMHLLFIAKNLERVGDHATGIAEQVIYRVTGEHPEEARPKSDTAAFIGGEENGAG